MFRDDSVEQMTMESTHLDGPMNNLKTRNNSVIRNKKSIADTNIDVSLQDMIDSV